MEVSIQLFANSWIQNRLIKSMYYVYILTNPNQSQYYIGYSKNLKRRFQEHVRGNPYWSKRLSNPQLYYYEAYQLEKQAKDREHKLKQYGSSLAGLLKRIGLK